jgi:hypothetical protein
VAKQNNNVYSIIFVPPMYILKSPPKTNFLWYLLYWLEGVLGHIR